MEEEKLIELFDIYINKIKDYIYIDKHCKLYLYGLEMQGKYGDNLSPEPYLKFYKRNKWKSWEYNKGMDKCQAIRSYIFYAKSILGEVSIE